MTYVYISPADQMYIVAMEYLFYELTGISIDVFVASHFME